MNLPVLCIVAGVVAASAFATTALAGLAGALNAERRLNGILHRPIGSGRPTRLVWVALLTSAMFGVAIGDLLYLALRLHWLGHLWPSVALTAGVIAWWVVMYFIYHSAQNNRIDELGPPKD